MADTPTEIKAWHGTGNCGFAAFDVKHALPYNLGLHFGTKEAAPLRRSPLYRHEFDIRTGFYKRVIWPGDDMSGSSRGTRSKGLDAEASQKYSQSITKVLEALSTCKGALSTTSIAKTLGKSRTDSYIKILIEVLIERKIVETTCERKRGARLQKYRLTDKGRTLAAKLRAKKAK